MACSAVLGTPGTTLGRGCAAHYAGAAVFLCSGFSLAPETADAVFQGKSLLREVAVERVREELLKLLCGRCVVPALLQYAEVLGVVLPEILPAVGCDQRNIHHCYDVWEHIARTVGFVPPDAVLRMTMLLHDLGKPGTMTVDEDGTGHFRGHADVSCTLGKTILERLRFDKESTRRILTLVQWHDVPIEQTQKAMRRLLHKLGEQGVRDLLQVKRADNLAQASAYHGRQGQIDTLKRCFSRRWSRMRVLHCGSWPSMAGIFWSKATAAGKWARRCSLCWML